MNKNEISIKGGHIPRLYATLALTARAQNQPRVHTTTSMCVRWLSKAGFRASPRRGMEPLMSADKRVPFRLTATTTAAAAAASCLTCTFQHSGNLLPGALANGGFPVALQSSIVENRSLLHLADQALLVDHNVLAGVSFFVRHISRLYLARALNPRSTHKHTHVHRRRPPAGERSFSQVPKGMTAIRIVSVVVLSFPRQRVRFCVFVAIGATNATTAADLRRSRGGLISLYR